MSVEEMEAIREPSFGKRYQRIRAALKQHGGEWAKNQVPTNGGPPLFLITYIIENQEADGLF